MRILQTNILHTGERDQTDYEKNWETADPVANLNLISSDTGVCPNFSTADTSAEGGPFQQRPYHGFHRVSPAG